MAWGKLVWGRDLRERTRTWILPPVIEHLPLTLKRTGLYPRNKEELGRAAQDYLDAGYATPQPIYAPQAAGRAGQWAQPSVERDSYVRSPYEAARDANAFTQGVSTPRMFIDPKALASMRRGGGQLPMIQGRDSASISADLLAEGRVSAEVLAEYSDEAVRHQSMGQRIQAKRLQTAQAQAAFAAQHQGTLSGRGRR